MLSIEQQRKLVALAGAVSTPYDLVRYNVEAHRLEIVVVPEPNPPLALAALDLTQALTGQIPTWLPLYRSLTSTSDN